MRCRLSAVADGRAAGGRHDDGRNRAGTAARVGRSAVCGAGVQDHDRSVRRASDVYPGVFGRAEDGAIGLQLDAKDARAYGALAPHAREQARRNRIDRSGRHRGVRRLEKRNDRRHAVRRREADRPRKHRFPHPGYFRSDRTQNQSRPGKNGHRARKAGAGRSDVPRAHRPRYGADADFRDGRAAPRDHRRPHDARIQRAGERGPAAGGVPRNDFEDGRSRTPAHQAVAAAAGSTAT